MTNRWLIVVVVASLALNVAVVGGFVLFRTRRPSGPPPVPGLSKREMREVRRMRDKFDPRLDSLRHQLNAARSELFRLAADSATPAEAESLLQTIGTIRVDMNRLAYENLREMLSKLSAEGREQVLRRLEHGPAPWHHRKHKRGRRDAIPRCPGPMPDSDDDD
jgi:hypothetical protein